MRTPTARYIWPIGGLLLIEGSSLLLVTQVDGAPPPITPLSVTAALLCLLVGLWPLFLRPSLTTQLSAVLGMTLAGFVLIPTRPSLVAQPPAGMLLHLLPAFMLYRLGHGVLLATVSFHVAAHFPPQLVTSACPRPTPHTIRATYGISVLLLVIFITIPFGGWRPGLFAALLLWVFWLLGRAIRRLACLSRTPVAEQPLLAQQARILLISALLAALPTFLLNLLEIVLDTPLARADLVALFLVIFPVGAAYTILRHDLFTLDGAIRRTLAYTILSALALLLYFTVTLILTVSVVRRWPQLANSVIVLSVLTTAFAFAPLQQRVQGLVDQWLYPERRRFQQAVTAARATLGSVVARNAVIALFTHQFPTAIGAQWAVLTLTPAPATPGHQPTPPAWQHALVVGDKVIGRYWLGPRQTLPTYESDEQSALQQLLTAAALVLAYGETIDALQQLNQELEQRVTTRTEQLLAQQWALAAYAERQQLARNLHDSITQSLFSLNLGLRAIRKAAQRDPQMALAQLPQQEAAAQQALAEMRTLLGQLRSENSAVETESVNLVERLQQLCTEQQTRHNLHITVETIAQFWCSGALAAELLAIAREALHNVEKHSGVHEATCTLTLTVQAVQLTIRDHGQGFDLTTSLGKLPVQHTIAITAPDEAGHFGLRGMQERVTAIGGQLLLESAPGQGTTVCVQVPRQPRAGSTS